MSERLSISSGSGSRGEMIPKESFEYVRAGIRQYIGKIESEPKRRVELLTDLLKRLGVWIAQKKLKHPAANEVKQELDKLKIFSELGSVFIAVLQQNPELISFLYNDYIAIKGKRDPKMNPVEWHHRVKAASVEKLLRDLGFFEYLPRLEGGDDHTANFSLYYEVLVGIMIQSLIKARKPPHQDVSSPLEVGVPSETTQAWAAATQAWEIPGTRRQTVAPHEGTVVWDAQARDPRQFDLAKATRTGFFDRVMRALGRK